MMACRVVRLLKEGSGKPIQVDGMGIVRLDKLTGEPEWRDFSSAYERNIQAFISLAFFYYNYKPRRFKNNPGRWMKLKNLEID